MDMDYGHRMDTVSQQMKPCKPDEAFIVNGFFELK